MAEFPEKPRQKTAVPRWPLGMILLPGFLSLLTHVMLVLSLALVLGNGPRSSVGVTNDESREVGIFIKEPGDHPDAIAAGEAHDGPASEALSDPGRRTIRWLRLRSPVTNLRLNPCCRRRSRLLSRSRGQFASRAPQ